jgi:hypothetical protein
MTVHQHPAAANVPPAAVMRVLQQFDRAELEGFISIAIGLLDVADGDADIENATNIEDDFALTGNAQTFAELSGPGCPIADVGEVDDEAEDDDPAGQCDEDGINTDYGRTLSGSPGCPISDNDIEHDGRELEDGL